MNSFLLLICIIFSFGLATANPRLSCSQLLAQNRQFFEFSDPRLNLRPGDSGYLGRGQWGVVTLHAQQNHQWAVEKVYSNQRQRNLDHRALEYLRAVFHSNGFTVVESKLEGSNSLKMNYQPGRTLEDLFADPKVSQAVKIILRARYLQIIDSLERFLKLEDFVVDTTRLDLPRVSAENDSFSPLGIFYIIKPDNIIVDPKSLEMTLIDPS